MTRKAKPDTYTVVYQTADGRWHAMPGQFSDWESAQATVREVGVLGYRAVAHATKLLDLMFPDLNK